MSVLNLSPEPEQEKIILENFELANQAKAGASWFYWIAALSVVNSLIFLFGGNWSFFAGLGITQIIDAIVFQLTQSETVSVIKIIGFAFDLVIAGIFVLCGLWANKLYASAFIAGMILYLFDGLLLLLIGAYFPAGFHAFALFMIFRGLSAARQIKANQTLAT
jgi:hypothetical protein